MVRMALLLGALLAPSLASATTYYVAPTGKDTHTCAQAQQAATPKATLPAGIQCLKGGDTLDIAAGSYTHGPTGKIPGGSSAGHAAIRRAGKGVTILLGSPAIELGHFSINNSWIELRDMTLDGALEAGVGVRVGAATHTVLRNLGITRQRNTGVIQINNSSHMSLLENLEISAIGNGNHLGFKHGIYLGSGSGHIIRGCYIHDNDQGYGMQLWEPPRNVLIENNIFERNRNGLWVGGSGHMIRNNVFSFNGVGSGEYGIVYQGGATGDTGGIYNNTFYGNEVAIGGAAYVKEATIRNNIFFNTGKPISGVPGTHTNNLTTDPGFIDAAAKNFCLKAGSAAINVGVTIAQVRTDIRGTARPQEGAYDLGAYEYPCTGTGPALPSPRNLRVEPRS